MKSEADVLGSNLDAHCLLDADQRARYVQHAISLGLPEVVRSKHRIKGNVAIVGTAPSVLDDIDRIRFWKGPVWAMNGALGLLLAHHITPDAWVSLDPMIDILGYLRETPSEITYYPASVCHPAVLARLKGLPKVYLWHLLSDVALPWDMMQIGGGPTTACRAPLLAQALGYRAVTLFGVDSSWEDDAAFHADGRPVPATGRVADDIIEVACENGRTYRTSHALLRQATYLGYLKQRFGGRLIVAGKGLAPDLCATVKAPH